jgi:hypothetical protein
VPGPSTLTQSLWCKFRESAALPIYNQNFICGLGTLTERLRIFKSMESSRTLPVDDNPNLVVVLFDIAVSVMLLVATRLKDIAVSGCSKLKSSSF